MRPLDGFKKWESRKKKIQLIFNVVQVRDSVYTAEQTARHTIMGQQLGDWDSNRLHLYQQV